MSNCCQVITPIITKLVLPLLHPAHPAQNLHIIWNTFCHLRKIRSTKCTKFQGKQKVYKPIFTLNMTQNSLEQKVTLLQSVC